MKKREIVLKPEDVRGVLAEAKKVSQRDYLLLKTMTVGDFRVGEIVGSEPRKSVMVDGKRTWVPILPNVKGLQIQDLHDDGVWVEGKGSHRAKNPSPPVFVPLPKDLVTDLRTLVGTRKEGKIFELSIGRVEQICRIYAKRAGVIDWKMVHPHRFRHYTTTAVARKFGVVAARDIARHSNISTTNRYISELPEDEKRKIIAEQEDLISV